MSGWPFGAYPPGGVERLGPHVVAFYGPSYPVSNSGVVRGSEATLVFDANIFDQARTLRSLVEEDGPPLRHLVLSHVHSDHAHGAMYFSPPATTWARSFTRDRLVYWSEHDLTPHAEEYAQVYPDAFREYAEMRIVVPERTVDEEVAIDLGGVVVRLRPEETAHTPGDLWAFVEPDGVALCGDLWFNHAEPYVGNGSLAGSLQAIAHLREAGARTYLPGHGPAGSLAPAGQDVMERWCGWVRERVDAGMSGGLRGEGLRARVRSEFEAQADRPGGIRFTGAWPGFLEDTVQKAEEDALAATG